MPCDSYSHHLEGRQGLTYLVAIMWYQLGPVTRTPTISKAGKG